MTYKIKKIIAFSLPFQLIFIYSIRHFPVIVETYYSQLIYPWIAHILHLTLGKIPFSIGDILYFVLAVYLIKWLIIRVKGKFKGIRNWIWDVLSTISLFYFLFHLLWGLNYYRIPLSDQLEIETQYTEEELVPITQYFIEKSNALQAELASYDTTKVDFPFDQKELIYKSYNLLVNNNISTININLKFNSLKPSVFSLPLTYMGFSGYLNPLTNEAQFNAKIPPFKIPTLLLHEMAHQLGYAKESEANFIAAIVSIQQEDPYFQYAGYSFAMQYCLGEIARINPEKAKELWNTINPGIIENFREVNAFWAAYENPLEPGFKLFYDHFLKVNNQPQGLTSYNQVVGLLVNYYKKEGMPD